MCQRALGYFAADGTGVVLAASLTSGVCMYACVPKDSCCVWCVRWLNVPPPASGAGGWEPRRHLSSWLRKKELRAFVLLTKRLLIIARRVSKAQQVG